MSTVVTVIQAPENNNSMQAWRLAYGLKNALPLGVALKLQWRLVNCSLSGLQKRGDGC